MKEVRSGIEELQELLTLKKEKQILSSSLRSFKHSDPGRKFLFFLCKIQFIILIFLAYEMRMQSSKKDRMDPPNSKDYLENKLKSLNENIEYDLSKANSSKRNLHK